MKIISIFSTLLAGTALFFSSNAFAGQSWYVDVTNYSNQEVEVLPVSETCWYVKDFTYPNTVKVQPGETKRLNTQEKNSGLDCFGSYKNLSFKVNGVPFGIEAQETVPVMPPFSNPYFKRDVNGSIFYTGTIAPWGFPDHPKKIDEDMAGNMDTLVPSALFSAKPTPLVKIYVNSDGSATPQVCNETLVHVIGLDPYTYQSCYN